ncbi:hypothetical protein NQ318_015438 [Aromia moschata]|uniref:Uncharacterized protein n=1 Tax=Aromia moschata TaxID=1265417 RepID=A0AAV8YSF6_9CUCU|nr:hypothetical protein NQ318_015438 [Aromia moschata]
MLPILEYKNEVWMERIGNIVTSIMINAFFVGVFKGRSPVSRVATPQRPLTRRWVSARRGILNL